MIPDLTRHGFTFDERGRYMHPCAYPEATEMIAAPDRRPITSDADTVAVYEPYGLVWGIRESWSRLTPTMPLRDLVAILDGCSCYYSADLRIHNHASDTDHEADCCRFTPR